MTFLELQNDVLDRLQYDNTQATSGPRTRMKRLLNQGQRRLLSDPRYTKVRDSSLEFATVASQPTYGLLPSIGKIKRIFDAATNNPPLARQSPAWLRRDTQANLATGTPLAYIPYGLHPVFRRPVSTGTGIWAASSSASDTTQKINLEAVRVGGYPRTTIQVQLTGTTRVQVGSRTDYVDFQSITLDAVCVGDVSVYDAATGGNVLGIIPIDQLLARYYLIQLYPVPSSVITYTVECQLAIADMVLNVDQPLIPADFHHLLSAYAIHEELVSYKKQLDTAAVFWAREITPLELNLLDYLINHESLLIVPGDETARQGNNLGSGFPAGRW